MQSFFFTPLNSFENNKIQFLEHRQDAKCSAGTTQLQVLDAHFSLDV